jgi:hypothetical protein
LDLLSSKSKSSLCRSLKTTLENRCRVFSRSERQPRRSITNEDLKCRRTRLRNKKLFKG